MKKKQIAIFTGNRAEYGLQYPIIKAIKESKYFDYKLLVSGAHLDKDFGNTLKGATTHPDGSSTLTTNGDGEITGSFIVPNNDNIKFRVGQVEFKIMDISANNEADAAAIAKAPYSAKGFLDTKEATYQSTRVLNVQGVRIRDNARYQVDDGGDNNHGKGTVISDANLVTGTTNTWSSDPNANTYGNWANEFAGLGSDPLDPFTPASKNDT